VIKIESIIRYLMGVLRTSGKWILYNSVGRKRQRDISPKPKEPRGKITRLIIKVTVYLLIIYNFRFVSCFHHRKV